MGRFQGAVENLIAEGMISGWEAICKLWQASRMLEDYAVLDDADVTVQQNLRDAMGLFEAALEKFSCNSVRYVVGHTYSPSLHELDPSDPELEALRQRREYSCSSDGARGGYLSGAAVAVVVRPGLEVSGILRARPRVWVSLPCTIAACSSSSPSSAATEQQNSPHLPSAHTGLQISFPDLQSASHTAAAGLLGDTSVAAASANGVPAAMADADTAVHAYCPEAAASASLFGRAEPVLGPGGQLLGAEGDSEGCATWQEWSPASGSGKGQEIDCTVAQLFNRGRPSDRTATVSAPALSTGGGEGSGPGSAAAAGPRGPLQLLLALRAGTSGTSGVSTIAVDCNSSTGGDASSSAAMRWTGMKAAKRPGWTDEQAGRQREAKDTTVPDFRAAVSRSAAGVHEPVGSDGRDEGNRDVYGSYASEDDGDDVCYQQYDTIAHHPASQHAPPHRPPPLVAASHPPSPLYPALVARSAAPLGGVAAAGGMPPSSSAVPVLLAMERAATCGASNTRSAASGPGLPLTREPAGPTAAALDAAAGGNAGQAAVTAGCRLGGGNEDGRCSIGAVACVNAIRGGGSGTPTRAGNAGSAFMGVGAAAALAAAAAFKAATAAVAAEAARLGAPVAAGRLTPQPSSAAAPAAASGAASVATVAQPAMAGHAVGLSKGGQVAADAVACGRLPHGRPYGGPAAATFAADPAARITAEAVAPAASPPQSNGLSSGVAADWDGDQRPRRPRALAHAQVVRQEEADPQQPRARSRAKSAPRVPRQPPATLVQSHEQWQQQHPPRQQRPQPPCEADASLPASVADAEGLVEDCPDTQGPADGGRGSVGWTRERGPAEAADAAGLPQRPSRANQRNATAARQWKTRQTQQQQVQQQQQQNLEMQSRRKRSQERGEQPRAPAPQLQQPESHYGRLEPPRRAVHTHQREHYERHPPQTARGALQQAQRRAQHQEPQRAQQQCVASGSGGSISAKALLADALANSISARGARGGGRCSRHSTDGGSETRSDDEGCEGNEPSAVAKAGGRRGGRGGWGGRGRGRGGGRRYGGGRDGSRGTEDGQDSAAAGRVQ